MCFLVGELGQHQVTRMTLGAARAAGAGRPAGAPLPCSCFCSCALTLNGIINAASPNTAVSFKNVFMIEFSTTIILIAA